MNDYSFLILDLTFKNLAIEFVCCLIKWGWLNFITRYLRFRVRWRSEIFLDFTFTQKILNFFNGNLDISILFWTFFFRNSVHHWIQFILKCIFPDNRIIIWSVLFKSIQILFMKLSKTIFLLYHIQFRRIHAFI